MYGSRPSCIHPGHSIWTASGQGDPVGHSSHPSMLGHHQRGVSKVLPCPLLGTNSNSAQPYLYTLHQRGRGGGRWAVATYGVWFDMHYQISNMWVINTFFLLSICCLGRWGSTPRLGSYCRKHQPQDNLLNDTSKEQNKHLSFNGDIAAKDTCMHPPHTHHESSLACCRADRRRQSQARSIPWEGYV